MRDSIDRYIQDLRALLHFELPEAKVDTVTLEAESHLRESTAKQLEVGVTLDAAQTVAIKSFGSPQRVALTYLQRTRRKLWGLAPVWWAITSSLVAIFCWNFHWLTLSGYFDRFGEFDKNLEAGFVGIFAVYVMVLAARRGLRSNRLWITLSTLGAATLSIPITAYWMIPAKQDIRRPFEEGVSRFHIDRDLPKLERNLQNISAALGVINQGIHDYSTASQESAVASILKDPDEVVKRLRLGSDRFSILQSGIWPFYHQELVPDLSKVKLPPANVAMTTDPGGKFVVPRESGSFVMVDGRCWVFETVDSFTTAKMMWQKYGKTNQADLEELDRQFKVLRSHVSEAKQGRLFFFEPTLYMGTVFATLFLLPIFLIVDWIGSLSGRPRGRRKVIA